jgi:ATP-binding cassette, subfamily C, bacterial
VSPARLIILDEAGSHLYPAAELQVERAFRQRGGTIITIAHLLDAARRADRILLLDTTPITGDAADLQSSVMHVASCEPILLNLPPSPMRISS